MALVKSMGFGAKLPGLIAQCSHLLRASFLICKTRMIILTSQGIGGLNELVHMEHLEECFAHRKHHIRTHFINKWFNRRYQNSNQLYQVRDTNKICCFFLYLNDLMEVL